MNASDNLEFDSGAGAKTASDSGVSGAPEPASQKQSAAPGSAVGQSPAPAKTSGPRVSLAEAFRQSGLDEWQIAQRMKELAETLSTQNQPKVLLDVLKESSRCIGNTQDAPLRVALVHRIPRPQREPQPELAAEPAMAEHTRTAIE